MIQIEHVYKTYEQEGRKVEAVKDANLHVQKGEIFGVIGYSGAGKSSLIRCINFLERPTSGSIRIKGVDLATLNDPALRAARRNIGMIFQNFNLLTSSTVYQNVAAPLQLAKAPKAQIDSKVMSLLELVGLKDKAQAYPSQLSGGQKQRVAIARALANDPEILLCDEATSALDPQTTDSILDLLLDINRKYNITIVLITHEMHVIKKICDRVAVMENGIIVEQGTVLDLFSNPQTATTKNFIKNVFDADLPPVLQSKFKEEQAPGHIIRVYFIGDSVTEPVIAELTERFSLKPSILYGNITQIKDTIFGGLLLKILGEPEAIHEGIAFLQSQGLKVEVLDYVK
ncbi:methionine ABC transporter ATP-binding protein [Paenibacillus sp. NPDC056579]|uniref:methionine ABC transporter ATP-binding protein n=1 Tax=Paenibacillus sp. NPDC056579 TaxID=3345871 RepID=UPI0036B7F088